MTAITSYQTARGNYTRKDSDEINHPKKITCYERICSLFCACVCCRCYCCRPSKELTHLMYESDDFSDADHQNTLENVIDKDLNDQTNRSLLNSLTANLGLTKKDIQTAQQIAKKYGD